MQRPATTTSCVLALLAAGSVFAAENAEPRWTRVETESFGVFSTATETRTLRVAKNLSTFRGAIKTAISVCAAVESLPTYIFVVGSNESFLRFWPRQQGAGGLFLTSDFGNYIAINATPGLLYGPLVHHEYVHHVLHSCYPGLPVWLEEGLAEYFSTFSIDGTTARVGDPIEQHLEWLRSNEWIPLTRVLTTTERSSHYNETTRAGGFYAQSWLLVHFLLRDRHPQSLIGLVATANEPDRLVFGLLQASVAEAEQKLRAYSEQRRLPRLERTVQELSSEVLVGTQPAPPGTALTRLGEMTAFAQRKFAAAESLFRVALAAAPERADARAGLAYSLARQGNASDAATQFDRAVAASPTDPWILAVRGKSSLDEARRCLGDPERIESFRSSLIEARKSFSRAVELDPDLWAAYADLGTTYVLDEIDPAPGIEALEKARELFPTRMHVVANLALLYARVGRIAEGRALMADLERRSRDSKLLTGTERSFRVSIYNYHVGRYNEAVVLLNDGQHERGVAILEAIEPEIDDAEFASQVRELLHRARERVGR